tara:strand:- start:12115 stop:13158 length:1044 start_codon:yes stop_codon:yes gene_type:complete
MIHVMIMAGGKGTRFWPLSRQHKPKQFLSILGDKSLIETTLSRVNHLADQQKTWILGSAVHQANLTNLTADADSTLLLEPCGRNTAACITWGAFEALKEDPNAICVVLSADAWIDSTAGFQQTIQQAIELVNQHDRLVTIGIPPTRPHTGYGYIQVADSNDDVFSVTSFTEKPTFEQAQTYLDTGSYYWNAGMFVWRAEHILECIKKHLPAHHHIIQSFTSQNIKDPNELLAYYERLEPISIDYGVLEHETTNMMLLPARFAWDDIGNWSSLASYLPQDEAHNATNSDVLAVNSHRNIVFSDHNKKVVLGHVDDLIVVDTADALLILPKEHDQSIKQIYDKLESEFQ